MLGDAGTAADWLVTAVPRSSTAAWRGAPPVDMAKAQHLLADLNPLSWALPHAAIAGFYLFLSGLITGFFANQAAYDDIGARLAQHPGLNRLLGARRTALHKSNVRNLGNDAQIRATYTAADLARLRQCAALEGEHAAAARASPSPR